MLIKLSAAALAAVGAKTADEFPEALVKLLNDTKAAASAQAIAVTDLQSALKTATDAAAELKLTVAAQAKTIEDLTAKIGNPSTLTEARIKEIATASGSAEAMKAIGLTGNGAPPAPPANNGSDAKTGVAALIAAGKFEEAFAADKNIQAEFDNAKSYAAFMKANYRGQVKITAKNQ